MVSIVLGIGILAIVVGAIIYAFVAMRDGGPKKRITPFGEVSDDNPEP
ncbi:MAG: hypothetical protein ACO1SV_21410 [Fimbriimonas sp.]